MSGDDKKLPDEGAPPEDEERTVFRPGAAGPDAPAPATEPEEPPAPDRDEPAPEGEAAWGAPPGADTETPPDEAWGAPTEADLPTPGDEAWAEPPEAEPAATPDQGWDAPPADTAEAPAEQSWDEPVEAAGEGGDGEPPADDPDDRTKWMPSPSPGSAEESWSTIDGDPMAPPPAAAPPLPPAPGYAPTQTGYPEQTASAAIQTNFMPNPGARAIEIGDVLNHIFEVTRFIAAGGMGKVYEGANVNSDERVAIKVMLPQLAADPNVISMFRKEARTLTKLQHEALVQYRVLAQEPQLGVLYIVTEFVDGTNLSDQLGKIDPGAAELTALLRRLASGLRAAHALNAIHRDISPDNVLLEGGKLSGAKIIDFGIAKDLDPGSATIVGDGFAGKLSYVAPEQLGDFGRNVGTWTDVYSLALVILAVALGRNVQMGGSLVDAVDKRRAGVDVSGAPEELRPVLEKMLKPNPAERLQTMDDVLAELDRSAAGPVAAPTQASRIPPLWIAGGVGALLIAIVGGWLLLSGPEADESTGPADDTPSVSSDPAELVRSTIDSALPSVNCTWLEIVDIQSGDGAPTVSFAGVAGNPAQAQGQLGRALEAASVQGANLDFEEVAPITPAGCAALDGFRTIRQPNPGGISVPQRAFEMKMQPEGTAYAGTLAANPIVELRTASAEDFTIIGIEPSGLLDQTIPSRAFLDQFIAENPGGPIQKTAEGYRLQVDSDHLGWTGLLLVTGKPPFDSDLVAPPLGARGPDWLSKFVSTAAERGWQTEMVWYKLVDDAPN